MLSLLKRLWVNTLRANLVHQARFPGSALLALETLEDRLTPSNFFVSPSGNDHNDGQSPATAWRTIAKVNDQVFGPGDTVSFQGGTTYNGTLLFYGQGGGTADNPVTITSYNGRATINSGSQNAVYLIDVSGFLISNLNLVGTSAGLAEVDGIDIISSGRPASHIYLDSVDVSGYGGHGIFAASGLAIQDLRITHTVVHDDIGLNDLGLSGIWVLGDQVGSQRTVSDVYIGDDLVRNNYDEFGIFLQNVNRAVVERSIVHDVVFFQGTQGVAAWDCDQVVFQHNESYSNTDLAAVDGHGFLFGNGVTNSVMQYNYAHENSGYGYSLVADLPGRAANVGNTLRYNISENDAQLSPFYAGMLVFGDVWNTTIYNNTIFNDLPGRKAVLVWSWSGVGLYFYNNILEVGDTNYSFQTDLSSQRTDKHLVFQGNAYYSTDGSFRMSFGDRNYFSLSDWQNATGQEMLGGTPIGYAGDPQLLAPGQGGTIDNPDLLWTLTSYTLQSTSPLSQAGLDLWGLFGIDPGTQDFYGDPLPQGGAFSIGANQLAGPSVKGTDGNLAVAAVTSVQAIEASQRAVDLVLVDLARVQKHSSTGGASDFTILD